MCEDISIGPDSPPVLNASESIEISSQDVGMS